MTAAILKVKLLDDHPRDALFVPGLLFVYMQEWAADVDVSIPVTKIQNSNSLGLQPRLKGGIHGPNSAK